MLKKRVGIITWVACVIGIANFSFIGAAAAYSNEVSEECTDERRYTFSWSKLDACGMKPRGGTSKGAEIELDPKPNPGWIALQDPELSEFERDRQAILAMAGPYRVSFDFLETMGFTAEYSPSQPYQSWGTEYVYVVEDSGDFISLQHIMVMVFEQPQGELSEPMVMKHWRQDWQFEQTDLFEYRGHHIWQKQSYSEDQMRGKWTQSVYQVDDSPRYQAFGKWQHNANYSQWTSSLTARPLPRRERSIRDDYHVLEGTNSHIVLPSGWVQEEHNNKLVLSDNHQPHALTPYLAREVGIARYERIIKHDFGPGIKYWQNTSKYWHDVRSVWQQLMMQHEAIKIHKQVDSEWMFMPFFQRAADVETSESYDSQDEQGKIAELIERFIQVCNVKQDTISCDE